MPQPTLALRLTGLASILLINLSMFLPTPAAAQFNPSQQKGLNKIGATAYATTGQPKDIRLIIGDGLRVVLGLIGFILVILMIISGLQYMLAAGNKTKIDTAVNRIKNAFIGLIIILIAYAATVFIIARLTAAVAGT
jgi:ABC-type dipeptide/oligopeptide/nickel transport system permease subunit